MSKYNLSAICRAANRFHKEGYSRSTAFVLAWRLSKQTANTKIAGVRYGDRQDVLAELAGTDSATVRVELRREQGNHIDPAAVAVVFVTESKTIKAGYIPAKAAALIAPLLDCGQSITATLDRIVGGWLEGISYGAQIRLAM